jgi:hypothetical protein
VDSLNQLASYVVRHTARGSCRCGECIDRPPEASQPEGHTANLIFFNVSAIGEPDRERFRSMAYVVAPHWFDGREHNFIEIGGTLAPQDLALRCMGLGALLGVWDLLTPVTVFGREAEEMPAPAIMRMAQAGYVAIQVTGGGRDERGAGGPAEPPE